MPSSIDTSAEDTSGLLEQRTDHVHRGGRFLDAPEAAAILDDAEARTADLRRAGFNAELAHDVVHHHHTGSADRMPLRHQASGHVDRNTATECRGAGGGERTAVAACAEAEV